MRLDPIEMHPYDHGWVSDFNREADRLRAVIDPVLTVDLLHIGSTAVPGLCAKPIIDMLAVVHDVDAVREVEDELHDLSWIRDPKSRDATEGRLSYCYPSLERRTHHLHVVREDHASWRSWVPFRDRLRRDPDLVAE